MNNENFQKQILLERSFHENFDEKSFGKYYFLLGHSITTFKSIVQWEIEILPYLVSLRNKTGKINDWNSFPWRGIICFRYNHVMILDESIEQIGRQLPGLKNENGENILNEDGDWLLDTVFVENNYTEYVKISLDKYISYCKQWIEILESENPI